MTFDLDDFLPYQLAVASARVSRALARRYEDDFGLTIPEWRVLAHLAKGDPLSVKDLSARTDMDKSKASRAASHLEAKGLVAKGPHGADGRLIALTLTDQGRATMARLIPMAKGFEDEVLTSLGPMADPLKQALTRLIAP
jgi:DNA-binding MarR family transcriptional regulator